MDYVNTMVPDGPMITIHKGWQIPRKKHRNKSILLSHSDNQSTSFVNPQDSLLTAVCPENKIRLRTPAQRQYEFINATTPERNKDPDVRKLVRTHVRNEYVRDTRRKKKTTLKKSTTHLPSPTHTTSSSDTSCPEPLNPDRDDSIVVPQFLGFPTALCISEYPIEMQPHTHGLLSRYMTHVTSRMYPLEPHLKSNPAKSQEWFRFAVTDAAMLHAMLYAGAIYLALLEGKRESGDTVYHLSQTISIVNKRLSESSLHVQDSTIGALSCLALGEAITGHLDLWHIHMRGLRQMIRTRGSISSLCSMLQTKLRRSDITGAIDYAATPYLDFHRSKRPSIWSTLPVQKLQTAQRNITRLLTACQVLPDLIAIMAELAHFSQAVQFARSESSILYDPAAFSEDMYWIEYKLLSFPTTLPEISEERGIDKACRLGALLYMKAILEEFPHSTTGSSILLKQLQESLYKISAVESYAPLLLWLSLVGAALSKTGLDRTWFVAHLAQLTTSVRISSFDDVELAMSRVLCIQKVFGRSFKKLWEEVMVRRRCCTSRE